MKPIRFILLIMLFAVATSAFAQAPQRFNYQAVARDGSGNPVSEKVLSVRISIIDGSAGGTSLYTETFSPTTSKQGLFSIQVGGGTVTAGTFSSIVWGSSPKFLKVEIDPAGGSAFALLGTSQLLSVPYAFAADKLASPLSIKDLSDVSDNTPSVDQVLKWDGSAWVPSTGGGLVTSSALSGDGSDGTPLTIAQQNATSGQVLQWSGTDWRPATISGGVGDNWGTQNVVSNATLSGAGTTASPLGIAIQGATPGQVLKYSGSAWTPAADAGDNWGTAKVNTSTHFEGDGTPGNPLKLGNNSAAVGQSLMWNGTTWTPQFLSGSITFPYTGAAANSGTAFFISNTGGTTIEGVTSNNNADVYGVKGTVNHATAGAGSAGVFGRSMSTNTSGYGVLGVHEGSGVGIVGRAKTGNGVGISGVALGPSGVGVSGDGAMGLYGIGSIGNGIGVYGTVLNGSGGHAGYFDEKVFIRSNSTATAPTLMLNENETGDRARLRFFNNVVGKFWDISANTSSVGADLDRLGIVNASQGEIVTVSGAGYVGISNVNPQQRLDVNGSIKLSGGIMVGNTVGANGQVLQSNGTVTTWGSATGILFNNTAFHDQTSDRNTITGQINDLPGLQTLTTFTLTGAAKAIFTFSHGQLVSDGSGDVELQVEIGFKNPATGAIINRAIINDFILNNKKKSVSFTHHCFFGGGSFIPYVVIGSMNSGKFNASSANGAGQVSVQVIPQ